MLGYRANLQRTNDAVIREALVDRLNHDYANSGHRIIPELGVWHGTARIDVAVVNGVLHGFEIKSDKDTLVRLHEQMEIYNSVFDKVTLVVGVTHLVDAFIKIPEWWGVETARFNENGSVFFNTIRESQKNPQQDHASFVNLLWRHEALDLLEEVGKASGVRSKPRAAVYERLVESYEPELLKERIRNVLQYSRQDWRAGALQA
jgi:hypothetical protein